jgi:hypothetical protein
MPTKAGWAQISVFDKHLFSICLIDGKRRGAQTNKDRGKLIKAHWTGQLVCIQILVLPVPVTSSSVLYHLCKSQFFNA